MQSTEQLRELKSRVKWIGPPIRGLFPNTGISVSENINTSIPDKIKKIVVIRYDYYSSVARELVYDC